MDDGSGRRACSRIFGRSDPWLEARWIGRVPPGLDRTITGRLFTGEGGLQQGTCPERPVVFLDHPLAGNVAQDAAEPGLGDKALERVQGRRNRREERRARCGQASATRVPVERRQRSRAAPRPHTPAVSWAVHRDLRREAPPDRTPPGSPGLRLRGLCAERREAMPNPECFGEPAGRPESRTIADEEDAQPRRPVHARHRPHEKLGVVPGLDAFIEVQVDC